jgi:hypothetical protein
LNKFREHFPKLKIAYIVLDRGYDTEDIHRTLYEEYKIIPVIIRKKTAYPKGYTSEGIPLCIWGLPMSRTGIDYTRKRTRYACRKNCQRAKQMTFKCPYLDSPSKSGLVYYTKLRDNYRKYGPAIPASTIYKKLKPLRTAIERNFGLVKENRYRMETTNTYMGLDNVLMHVIEHDIALTLDIIFMFKKMGNSAPS